MTPLSEALDGADAVTFTSSSTVTGFVEVAGAKRVPAVVACIGRVTAQTAREAGLRVDVVAPVHTVDGLVAALVAWAEHHKGGPERPDRLRSCRFLPAAFAASAGCPRCAASWPNRPSA